MTSDSIKRAIDNWGAGAVHDSDALPEHEQPSYDGGDGGGSDMEQRVRQLETDMSYIKGKLEDMPTKDWVNGALKSQTRFIVSLMTVGFLLLGALITLADSGAPSP